MLDLQPIKDRLAAATPGPWAILENENSDPTTGSPEIVSASDEYSDSEEPRGGCYVAQAWDPCDAPLIANAPTDLAALVAEVERLRGAIQAHREKLTADSLCDFADMELWEVLNA